ncbi:DUF6522 family protein [Loktanella sp. M215]|uniref:DUF6522 family protein n=1 Tax=Loktanella sp. M215 TaxID=2675431 RepID=UPI001F440651|nr:DUF6522 family protein [Loktanella sp. M215]MCF7701868.1 hypothetical protein [Loktanella sp. M215]
MKLSLANGQVTVDGADLAPLLAMEPDGLRRKMRDGDVRILSETGEGDDAGRQRVTFWTKQWRVRLTCDAEGVVVKQSRARIGP